MAIKYKTNLIKKYLKDNKIGKVEFCKRCGISLRTLNKVLTDSGDIGSFNAVKLVTFLHCQIKDIVVL